MAPEGTVHRRIAGRYTLLDPLGRGGMGVVWRGHDELLQREVAVKQVELPEWLPKDECESVRARVLREAQAAARVLHPALVTVFDVTEEQSNVYIVMELVAAQSLSQLVAAQGPLPPSRAAQVGLELLSGIEAAHRSGIVHRDVKPSNIMVLEDGSVKLADFGIASVKGHPSITATGLVLGSPGYMAPEQAQGQRSGPAADLWALGATLYYAVEGRPPFDRDGAIATLTAVVHEEPQASQRAGALSTVISSLLDKDPDRRPSAEALRPRLAAVADDYDRSGGTAEFPVVESQPRPEPVVPPAPPPSPPEAEPEPPVPSTVGPRPDRQSWRRAGALVALAVVVLAVGLVAWATGRGERQGPSSSGGDTTEAPREASDEERDGSEARGTTPPRRGETDRGVPSDWVSYTNPDVGYRIARPPGWQVQQVDRTRTDIRDPKTGSYLRIDWTASPGPSPVAAWQEYSKTFASRHEGYREIRIESTTYKGFDAAIWEYSYSSRGGRLRAVDLGIVTGKYGFALNFQTAEQAWEESQPTFDAFKAAFQPVG